MLGRSNKGVSGLASDALDSVSPYTDRLADEKVRERLVAALTLGAAARRRAKNQTGLTGLARRLASDTILRAQISEAVHQLQKAKGRVRKSRSHKTRNTLLFVTSVGMVVAAVPSLRAFVLEKLQGADDWAPDTTPAEAPSAPIDTPETAGAAPPSDFAHDYETTPGVAAQQTGCVSARSRRTRASAHDDQSINSAVIDVRMTGHSPLGASVARAGSPQPREL